MSSFSYSTASGGRKARSLVTSSREFIIITRPFFYGSVFRFSGKILNLVIRQFFEHLYHCRAVSFGAAISSAGVEQFLNCGCVGQTDAQCSRIGQRQTQVLLM